jgi:hypothetical protein
LSGFPGIRNLRIKFFNFGRDAIYISQTIKRGFYRLVRLALILFRGDLRMFIENVSIQNLISFECEGSDKASCVASKNPTIKRLSFEGSLIGSTTLLSFVYNCRDLVSVFIIDYNNDELSSEVVKEIETLPHLKNLRFDCRDSADAAVSLVGFRGLKSLALSRGEFDLTTVLSSIGPSLVSLEYNSSLRYLATIALIVEKCANLQVLGIRWSGMNDKCKVDGEVKIKEGLKKLWSLKIDKVSKYVGTDWVGYGENSRG